MKICAAQIQPFTGDVQKNIEMHIRFINIAVSHGANIIVFPELSLTGYEPELAKELAVNEDDIILNVFQEISDNNQISICVGMPLRKNADVLISMFIFQPHLPRQIYSKQHLHEDELPYFVNGSEQVYITIDDTKISPAICYESLLPKHAENAFANGAQVYMASVAKSAKGIDKAYKHYPDIAKKYTMPVLMVNCTGYCDNFESAGQSSAWNSKGVLSGSLNEKEKGMLIFDTDTEQVIVERL